MIFIMSVPNAEVERLSKEMGVELTPAIVAQKLAFDLSNANNCSVDVAPIPGFGPISTKPYAKMDTLDEYYVSYSKDEEYNAIMAAG